MRLFLSTLFVCCFICTFSFKTEAHHFAGAEISYACTSTPGIFDVTLVMYRRCDGGVAFCPATCGSPCPMTLSFSGADSGFNTTTFGTITLQLQQVRDVDVKATCPNVKSMCTNRGCVTPGTSSGYERYQFKGTVNLGPTSGIPAACCNIRIWSSLCCRSSDINTGPANQNFYVEAIINRCYSVSPCNSSPVFHNDPQMILSGGENYVGNWGAIDPDHDSLSYSFAPALTAQGTSVTYLPPFAYDRPLPWTGSTGIGAGIHCDPNNGDIMFTPPNAGGVFTGMMCITVKQWKKIGGVPTLIGTTRRDIETRIEGYPPNNPPRLITSPPEDNNVNIPRTIWSVCAGEQLCFTVTAKDTDFNPPIISDTTYIRWNGALANMGATFTPDYDATKRQLPDSLGGGPREDRYKFCWTPADSLARSTPYYFTLSAADNRCPNPGELTRSFSILVYPKAAAQIVQSTDICQNTLLNYINLTPSVNIISANWRIAKTPNDSTFLNGFDSYTASTTPTPFLFKNAGRFYIQLIVESQRPTGTSGCSSIFTSYVDAPGISLKDSIQTTDLTCAAIPTGKIVLKGYNGTPPYQYKLNNHTYSANPIFTNLIAGQYIAWVKDSNGCETIDTVWLNQPHPFITTIKTNPPSCNNDSKGSIIVQATGGVPPYMFQLNQNGFNTDSVFNNVASGFYQLMVKDANNCINTDSVILQKVINIFANYTITPTSCFNGNDGKIQVASGLGRYPFTYRLNQLPAQSTPSFENLPAGKYLVTLIDSALCIHTDSVTVTQPTILSYVKNKTEISCFNANDGSISIIPGGGIGPYQLSFGAVLYPLPSTLYSVKPGNYRYHIIDSKNCQIELTDSFKNPEQISAGIISGDAIVTSNSTHSYSVPFQANLSFVWGITGGTLLSSSVNPPLATVRWDTAGIGKIWIVAYNNFSCGDTSTLQVNIGSVGLTELSQSWGLNVYPNPAKNSLNIQLQKLPEQTQIQLYDVQGKLVLQQELKLSQQLNIETLAPGMYMLKIGAWSGQVVKE